MPTFSSPAPTSSPETIHQLQHFSVVQMFAHATDLGPRHEPLRSFEVSSRNGCGKTARRRPPRSEYGAWHPGYAWACRRDAWDHLGGLIDFAIVGSADRYMACALIGEIAQSLSPEIVRACPTYTEWCLEWQTRAETYIKRNIGFVDGLLLHYFHGAKKNRGYCQPLGNPVEQPVRSGERHQARLAGHVATDRPEDPPAG